MKLKKAIKSFFSGVLLAGVLALMVYAIKKGHEPRIIRMQDGHQYVEVGGYDGSRDIEHLEGCDHEDHKENE